VGGGPNTAAGPSARRGGPLDKQTEFIGAELLIGIPEHHVRIVGGGHASQTDLWALMRAPIGLVSVAVEAKAGESFDDAFPDWLHGAPTTSGKPARLAELQRILNLTEEQAHRCRYQLRHRAAAAIIEANRFKIGNAFFLVQSFASSPTGEIDYKCFGEQLGAQLMPGRIMDAGLRDGVRLWLAWLSSTPADDATVRAAIA
jgi:hypothetical protein